MKNRVTGLGGVFFKTKDPDKIKDWYKNHLGLNTDQYGLPSGGKIKRVMIVLRNGAPSRKITPISNPVKRNL